MRGRRAIALAPAVVSATAFRAEAFEHQMVDEAKTHIGERATAYCERARPCRESLRHDLSCCVVARKDLSHDQCRATADQKTRPRSEGTGRLGWDGSTHVLRDVGPRQREQKGDSQLAGHSQGRSFQGFGDRRRSQLSSHSPLLAA